MQVFQIRKHREIFALISHISFILWIFQRSLAIKNHSNSTASTFSRSGLIDLVKKCLKILIWKSFKEILVGTWSRKCNAVFENKKHFRECAVCFKLPRWNYFYVTNWHKFWHESLELCFLFNRAYLPCENVTYGVFFICFTWKKSIALWWMTTNSSCFSPFDFRALF